MQIANRLRRLTWNTPLSATGSTELDAQYGIIDTLTGKFVAYAQGLRAYTTDLGQAETLAAAQALCEAHYRQRLLDILQDVLDPEPENLQYFMVVDDTAGNYGTEYTPGQVEFYDDGVLIFDPTGCGNDKFLKEGEYCIERYHHSRASQVYDTGNYDDCADECDDCTDDYDN